MIRGYVLLNVKGFDSESVIEQIAKMENVVEVRATYGMYDLVVIIEAADTNLWSKTHTKIRMMSNIQTTVSLVVIDEMGGKST